MNARLSRRQILAFGAALAATTACGRAPSSLLRQEQLPIMDFPLYLSEGVGGKVWKIERDRTKTLLVDGLNDPRGIATDRYDNIYVAEFGAGRLLKVDTKTGSYTVVRDGMSSPSLVAVDQFGEPFVAQDGSRNIIRATDQKEHATYGGIVSAFVFGVGDLPIVGVYDAQTVTWGGKDDSPSHGVPNPVAAAIDGTGRVYLASGDPVYGAVHRFHQREPGGDGEKVAEFLQGPVGLAVDSVGNLFVAEQGANRIVLVHPNGDKFAWLTDLSDPQSLAFTQY